MTDSAETYKTYNSSVVGWLVKRNEHWLDTGGRTSKVQFIFEDEGGGINPSSTGAWRLSRT